MSSDLFAEFSDLYSTSDGSKRTHPSMTATTTAVTPAEKDTARQITSSNSYDIWDESRSGSNSTQYTDKNTAAIDLWSDLSSVEFKNGVQVNSGLRNGFTGQSSTKMGRTSTSGVVSMDSRPIVESLRSSMGGRYVKHADTAGLAAIPTTKPPKPANNSDVLFDADNISDDEDDFGDFETVEELVNVEPQHKQYNHQQSTSEKLTSSALSLKPSQVEFPYPQAPKSPGFHDRNPYTGLAVATPELLVSSSGQNKDSPITAWPACDPNPAGHGSNMDTPTPVTQGDTTEWDDFADLPVELETPVLEPLPTRHYMNTSTEADAWAWDAIDNVESVSASMQAQKLSVDPPPTNIPPPSILLAFLPTQLNLPQSALYQPLSTQPHNLKAQILSNPSTIAFLRAYVAIATVAAHILAGRRLRWKRDTHLLQAMSIGTAGGRGGMKLSSIDRTEAVREDREASELVRAWTTQVGKLRSVIAMANSSLGAEQGAARLDMPEIVDVMPLRKEGLTSVKACVVCGLKRDERVKGVDGRVDDSFGEFWVEFWGHRDCKAWWLEHQDVLKSR